MHKCVGQHSPALRASTIRVPIGHAAGGHMTGCKVSKEKVHIEKVCMNVRMCMYEFMCLYVYVYVQYECTYVYVCVYVYV